MVKLLRLLRLARLVRLMRAFPELVAMCKGRARNRGSFLWLTGVDYWIFVDFQWNPLKMGVLVHPLLGLRFGAALPGFFFLRKTTLLRKNIIFYDFSMIFHQNGPNLVLTRGIIIKTGILPPVELWWVP